MGNAPPPDAPPPAQQDQSIIDAGFEPSPTGNSICGFGLPSFSLSVNLPVFPPKFEFPPNLNLSLGLNCDLSDPISADVSFGGGRVGSGDPSEDDDP